MLVNSRRHEKAEIQQELARTAEGDIEEPEMVSDASWNSAAIHCLGEIALLNSLRTLPGGEYQVPEMNAALLQ